MLRKGGKLLANDGSCCITCHFIFVTCKRVTYKECGQTFGFHLVDREVMDRVVVCFLPRMFVPVVWFSSSAKTRVSNFQFSLDRGWKSSYGFWDNSLCLKQSSLFIRCVKCMYINCEFLSSPVNISVSTAFFVWLANRKKTFGDGCTCRLNCLRVT